ncbi:MAG: serine/threonine protein kinase [Myxococcales bacterium]|nr:serine/threonine protein kinase [Myxococcales bacterium]
MESRSPSAAEVTPGLARASDFPVLEEYELLDEVGHGGMATVYRARDPRLEREVAVKIIHRHLRENAEVAARFTSEARAVAKLRHPNIVEVYDVSREEDPERFLVVELVRGTTLRKLLSEHQALPPEIAVLLGLEVGKALEHAHSHGVVHRDIKPENVLVALPGPPRSDPRGKRSLPPDDSGQRPSEPTAKRSLTPDSGKKARDTGATDGPEPPRVKLTDFGIAKVLDAQGVTSTGQVLGSPAHMAPEQIEGGDVDERADVFGLGVLLYETMVGQLPFHGRNPAQVLRRVLDGLYEPAVKERPEVGARWSALLDRALAKRPEDRFQSVTELMEAAQEILEELEFVDGKQELALYFADPEAYRESYKTRLVARLADLAKRARSDRQVVLATQLFNRALAFKPGDPDLLRQVSGIARSAGMRRVAVRVGLIAAGSLVLGGVAFLITGATRSETASANASATPAAMGTTPETRFQPRISTEPSRPPTTQSASPRGRAPRLSSSLIRRLRLPPPAAKESGTRMVQVVIKGAAGTASVEGVPIRFGQKVELPVGPHSFEFKPADEKCCYAEKASVSVTIRAPKEPGDKGDVQTVFGHIKIRDATLSISGGPPGATVTCRTLFGDTLTTPAEKSVPMGSQLKLDGACTLTPPKDSGESPRTRSVRLVAGQVTALRF